MLRKHREKMPAPEPGQSWGILGGIFDPVHLGHIRLADDIQKAGRLDGVLFVPSFDPPHRQNQQRAPFEDRVAMLQLAVVDHCGLEVSDIEHRIDRPGYTLNTIRALKKDHAGVVFQLVIGADNLHSFRTWYRWEQILEEVKLLVGSRPGTGSEGVQGIRPDRMELLSTGLVDVSSTMVRARARENVGIDELSNLVPRPVAEYIVRNELYR